MCAGGALRAHCISYFRRRRNSAPSSLIVLSALLAMVHHYFSAPTTSTKQTFVTCNTTMQHYFAKGARCTLAVNVGRHVAT